MIKSFTVTNYLGDSIKIELERPEKSGFIVASVSGLGPTKATINTTEISMNDGSLFNSAKLSSRNIVFQLFFDDSGGPERIEGIRQKSYRYFPVKKNLELLIETDNRLVKTVGYVEANEPNIFSAKEGTQISVICPDPGLYSMGPEGNQVTVFYGVEANFSFPFCNNSLTKPTLIFGNIQNKTENVITYSGDAEVGLTIKIHAVGPVSNISIYNTKTKEKMRIDTVKLAAMTGSGIIASDDITIETSKGKKEASLLRNGQVINIRNCLEMRTDWFKLVKGDNLFAFVAETGTTNLQFRVENQVIYEGV